MERKLAGVSLWHFDKDGELVEHQTIPAQDHPISSVRVDDGGRFLAIGDEAGGTSVWRLGDGPIPHAPAYQLKTDSSPVRQFSFGATDDTLVIRGTTSIAAVDLAKAPLTVVELPSEDLDLPNAVASVFLERSSDGHWIAGNGQRKVRIWELKPGPVIGLHRDVDVAADSLSFSPDNRFLVADKIDETIVVLLTPISESLHSVTFPRQNGNGVFYSVPTPPSFSRDGKWLAILAPGPQDTVNIFDVHTDPSNIHLDQPYARLASDNSHIVAYTLSADGTMALICDESPLCQLWELHAGTYEPTPLHSPDFRAVSSVMITSDVRWAVTVSAGREGITRWPLIPGDMRKIAARAVGRNLSNEEWKLYFAGQKYRGTFRISEGVRD